MQVYAHLLPLHLCVMQLHFTQFCLKMHRLSFAAKLALAKRTSASPGAQKEGSKKESNLKQEKGSAMSISSTQGTTMFSSLLSGGRRNTFASKLMMAQSAHPPTVARATASELGKSDMLQVMPKQYNTITQIQKAWANKQRRGVHQEMNNSQEEHVQDTPDHGAQSNKSEPWGTLILKDDEVKDGFVSPSWGALKDESAKFLKRQGEEKLEYNPKGQTSKKYIQGQ